MPQSIATLARRPTFVVVIAALAFAAAVDPRGEFPVNDDWAYAHSVQWLLTEHRIRLSDWIAMNLLPQTLAGGLVVELAGFSFSVLRHLTQLVSAAVAALALHWFLVAGVARRDALFATLTVMAVPCWLPLANSYMTDLYGMVFALPAAALFLRALREPKPAIIAAATLLAAAGVLQRQVVLVVPVAFFLAWLTLASRRRPAMLVLGVAPTLVALGAAFVYMTYLEHGPGVPAAQQMLHNRVLPALLKTVRNEDGYYRHWVTANLFSIVAYLGLFASPFVLWRGGPANTAVRIGIAALAAIAIATMAFTGLWPPWRDAQMIDAAGIGPFALYDAQPRGLFTLDRSTRVLWWLAGAAAAIGIAGLCRTLLAAVRAIAANAGADKGVRLYLLAMVVGYVAPFVVTDYIDRYLLFVLPFALALVALAEPTTPTRLARTVGALTLCAALALGVMATHDYFAWNRARWDAIREAERLGATPATLDGGFEYNAYHRFEIRPRVQRPGKSWWWVDDDRFVVAFGAVPGYIERARFTVKRWLPRTPSAVLLLERARR